MNFKKELISSAKSIQATIVFPEALISDKIMQAVDIMLKHKMCRMLLLGDPKKFAAKYHDSKDIIIIDPKSYGGSDELAEQLYTARRSKGMTLDGARELVQEEIYLATMLVRAGNADGMVCGIKHTTAETLRPALQLLRAKDAFVSSSMILVKGKNRLVFSDCAMIIDPNADELAKVADNAVKVSRIIANIVPIVAMLSYSSLGSGSGESVDKVKAATAIISASNPDYLCVGEVQSDVALNTSISASKKVKELSDKSANVLIFPNLNAGNIGYKLVQELSHYSVIGPILSNLERPINDLSRGASVDDIILTTAVTILQSKRRK